ncbi:MAG: (2Fe-2S)-binding protein [Candidatus Eremiobacteraeota bacterium]|nr:(2Fe-2S)-binding protein [Candidatus Eremiobacteraeota bacterium]MBV8366830.1 (2Fe-2S)-binding protein [Candidatus Eremiobacteraeota bacterium]
MTVAPPKVLTTLDVNGAPVQVAFHPNKTLLEVLREDLGLTGTKHGCEMGHCGACCVLVDEQPVLSCLALAIEMTGHKIRTVEGLATNGHLHPIQQAFAECGAAQCGYCTPGFLMTGAALVEQHGGLSETEIREAIAGNLCRCTGYTKIIEAIQLAATRMERAASSGYSK